jgi:predicted Zn-dependent peptidase
MITVSILLWLLSISPAIPNLLAFSPFGKSLPQKKVLENGLTMIWQKDESSAITVVQILIKGGQRAEPDGKQGLSYLTTRLTLEIPDQGKVQDLMSQSSRFFMSSKGDFSFVDLECLSQNLEDALKVITSIILDPLFSGIRIDNIKKFMLHKGKAEEDDSVICGHKAALNAFFGKAGYGGSVYGGEQTLKAIKNKDISTFYETYFKANDIVLSVSSDLDEQKLMPILQKYFSKFKAGKELELPSQTSSPPAQKEIFLEKDTKQTFVSFAFLLPKLSAKNYALAYLVENLLGNGFGSKLWFLRSEEKLAYNVNAQATQMKEGGILEAYLETDAEKKEKACEALKKALQEVYEKSITEGELQATKTYSKAEFLWANETKAIRTRNFAFFEVLGLGSEFGSQLFSELDSINLQEINSYIKDILNLDKAVQIVVGRKV